MRSDAPTVVEVLGRCLAALVQQSYLNNLDETVTRPTCFTTSLIDLQFARPRYAMPRIDMAEFFWFIFQVQMPTLLKSPDLHRKTRTTKLCYRPRRLTRTLALTHTEL